MAFIVRAYDGDEMYEHRFETEEDADECVYDYRDGYDYRFADRVETPAGDVVIILISPEVR